MFSAMFYISLNSVWVKLIETQQRVLCVRFIRMDGDDEDHFIDGTKSHFFLNVFNYDVNTLAV